MACKAYIIYHLALHEEVGRPLVGVGLGVNRIILYQLTQICMTLLRKLVGLHSRVLTHEELGASREGKSKQRPLERSDGRGRWGTEYEFAERGAARAERAKLQTEAGWLG